MQPGNHHAQQKDNLRSEIRRVGAQAPKLASSQKAVVQAVVSSQHVDAGGGMLVLPKVAQPGGFVPKKHLQHQNLHTDESDKRDDDDDDGGSEQWFPWMNSWWRREDLK